MSANYHTIHDQDGNPVNVQVLPDRRLKKSARWLREHNGLIVLRVPYRMPREKLDKLLVDIAGKLGRMRTQAESRTDEDLEQRASYVNRKFFNDALTWTSIRWVGNMQNRLGSCTNGGPTDGHIRISERIRDWPQWMVDYVIAHELAHRRHPDHSPEFWAYLRSSFPQTERALGFIQGVSFARNEPINGDY
jgi:predicted metal-dependent hydrolase